MWSAEGQIQGVRSEVKDQPMQILVRCDKPAVLAARLFDQDNVVEALRSRAMAKGCWCARATPTSLYLLLNRSCSTAVWNRGRGARR
jgi:ABC-2 type transport system ATP-binding protein